MGFEQAKRRIGSEEILNHRTIEVSPEARELAMDFISLGQDLPASSRTGTTR